MGKTRSHLPQLSSRSSTSMFELSQVAEREQEQTAEVIDGPTSVVYEQAEVSMHLEFLKE